MVTGARHANTFDFLRLLAATVVVIAHASHDLDAPFLWGFPWIVDGVAMFFVMSGMLVYRSAERSLEVTGSLRDYARNRFLRVAPAIYVFALTMPLIFAAVTDIRFRDLLSTDQLVWLGTAAVLAPNSHPTIYDHIGTGNVNGHLYTIPAEVSFYVAVPVLIWLAARLGFARMLLLMLPVAVLAPVIANSTGGIIPRLLDHTFLELFAYFLAGVFWAHYWKRTPKQWWLFALALAWVTVLRFTLPGTRVDVLLHPVLWAVPLSYAVVWFGYQGPKALARLTNRIGDISFGTYIWHVPVIVLFAERGWVRSWWVVPAVVLCGWGMGAASWWLIERPFHKLKRVSERQAETGHLVPEVGGYVLAGGTTDAAFYRAAPSVPQFVGGEHLPLLRSRGDPAPGPADVLGTVATTQPAASDVPGAC